MYVCVQTCIVRSVVFDIDMSKTFVYPTVLCGTSINAYIHTYIRMYVCMYVRTYVPTYVCMYVRTYVRMYVCTYLCVQLALIYSAIDLCVLRPL